MSKGECRGKGNRDRVRLGSAIVSIAGSKDVLGHPLLARWQLGVAGAVQKIINK